MPGGKLVQRVHLVVICDRPSKVKHGRFADHGHLSPMYKMQRRYLERLLSNVAAKRYVFILFVFTLNTSCHNRFSSSARELHRSQSYTWIYLKNEKRCDHFFPLFVTNFQDCIIGCFVDPMHNLLLGEFAFCVLSFSEGSSTVLSCCGLRACPAKFV